MGYQKVFNKPYEEGYKNLPDKSTPVTAEILNMQDNTFSNVEDYLEAFTEGMPDSPLYQLLQNSIPQVNPEMEGNEEVLTGLQVGEDKYKIPTYDDTELREEITDVKESIETTHTTAEKTIEDASDGNIVSLSLVGATTQGANPSPSNPQPINGFDGSMGTHDDNGNESTIHTFPLYSIGDVKDELRVYSDGSGELIKRIKKVDLGTFTYQKGRNTTSDGSSQFYIQNETDFSNVDLKCLCDYFYKVPFVAQWSGLNGQMMNDANYFIFFSNTHSDVTSFKEFMTGETLYYEAPTPTTTKLTPSEVSEILKLKTYSNKTYIDAENVDFELEYFADSEIGKTMADIKSTFLNLLLQPTHTNSEQD